MTYVYKEVEVEFDLSDLEDEDLIEELQSRKISFNSFDFNQTLNEIYLCRKLSVPYEHLVDKLIYETLGKII